ncbi:FKBP-type peptidyl-prolyl cis-trans isomerase [Cellulomonas sp. APG4]|uniref:FKBP-type peptidyl-prolyl cis-trans isomerase n=1 Tax=Cellulomonas sp. APG4 TaxID=1538656 RepID=UPI00137B35EE|nr:FKBP-type peptidyl-prolyl cis-trans isomerase [Cellulomonas sp. APG4]
MRRLAAAPVALIATALLLAGCSGDAEPEATPSPTQEAPTVPEPSADDVAALDDVTLEGEAGAPPTVTFDQPFDVSAAVARVVDEGTGDALELGQELQVNYVVLSGEDGSQLASTWELGSPERLSFTDQALVPALIEALTDQQVGTRLLFAAPGTEGQAATETTQEIPASPATVIAMEVVEATFPRAEGEPVEPPAGLPTVELGENGEPSIEIPADAEKPTELVVQPLIKGDGAVVEAGQNVRIHYTGVLWDGTEFDSSWGRQPLEAVIGAGQLIEGWDEGVVGQTVGSQVLLVVPPEKGYGAEGSGTIPGDATLVFVVDILEATAPVGS